MLSGAYRRRRDGTTLGQQDRIIFVCRHERSNVDRSYRVATINGSQDGQHPAGGDDVVLGRRRAARLFFEPPGSDGQPGNRKVDRTNTRVFCMHRV